MENYADHAANERTFLAWLRTGLAVTAFGLLLAKMDRVTVDLSKFDQKQSRFLVEHLATLQYYDSIAVTLLGIIIIILGAMHFRRVDHEIDLPHVKVISRWHVEIGIAASISLLVSIFCLISFI